MDEFCRKLAQILEVDEVKPDDALEDFEEWDSLSALTVIAMAGCQYGVPLRATELKKLATPRHVYDFILRRKGMAP
jgi:acyl carrier protein